MRLAKYLDSVGMTRRDFAQRVECSENHMHLICRGERAPSRKLASRIIEATDGEVTWGDLYDGSAEAAAS